ncbi:hypothetical protein Zmor_008480 [Zophobas morio]|uniref:Uncharacterized protein n=1 Tax=Zophobas morio TaxID=2755281 RepID=A0AA38MQT3_9CUCU|nr:hypothetical protein Zmor_008480 [Zophobas morio]
MLLQVLLGVPWPGCIVRSRGSLWSRCAIFPYRFRLTGYRCPDRAAAKKTGGGDGYTLRRIVCECVTGSFGADSLTNAKNTEKNGGGGGGSAAGKWKSSGCDAWWGRGRGAGAAAWGCLVCRFGGW